MTFQAITIMSHYFWSWLGYAEAELQALTDEEEEKLKWILDCIPDDKLTPSFLVYLRSLSNPSTLLETWKVEHVDLYVRLWNKLDIIFKCGMDWTQSEAFLILKEESYQGLSEHEHTLFCVSIVVKYWKQKKLNYPRYTRDYSTGSNTQPSTRTTVSSTFSQPLKYTDRLHRELNDAIREKMSRIRERTGKD